MFRVCGKNRIYHFIQINPHYERYVFVYFNLKLRISKLEQQSSSLSFSAPVGHATI